MSIGQVEKAGLHNSSNCEESNPDWIKKVFITPDLTPKEQQLRCLERSYVAEFNKTTPRSHCIKTVKL